MNNMCFCNLNGKVITKDSPLYEEVRQDWNRANQEYPIAFVYCESVDDISSAIKYAIKKNIPIRIRSHGHNYQGYSSGNHVLVIDVSLIDFINICPTDNNVTVGCGAYNALIYDTLGEKNYPFPSGTCPTVGATGLSLGGGWGLSCRKFGLTCDNIIEIKIVDYKGELLTCNESRHADLFWALRGAGGGNFGVVYSIKFKLPHKVNLITEFTINYPNISFEKQVEIIDIFQHWISCVDNDINIKLSITNIHNCEFSAKIIGLSYKDISHTTSLLEPFLNISNVNIELNYVSFKEAVNNIFAVYPNYEYFQCAGRFVNKFLSKCEIEDLLNIIHEARPEGSVYTELDLYGLGGKTSAVDCDDTAFYYRDSKFILLFQTVFENNYYKSINDKWVHDNYHILYNLTKGSYINFPYNDMVDPLYEYYGDNLCRLGYIKNKYDPHNIFTFPQGL